ncbi:MAG TPA: hypothetical protein DCZ00_00660 [Lactococcus sp.]|uniref:hypothetical protein n=1 Tax=Lactococcus TaxID=1357 RepID=UPI000E86F9F2|nr:MULTISPECIES: hypothetical protein [Lactococcus]HBC89939.1 hypothetical protein [Lactococcus sp.]
MTRKQLRFELWFGVLSAFVASVVLFLPPSNNMKYVRNNPVDAGFVADIAMNQALVNVIFSVMLAASVILILSVLFKQNKNIIAISHASIAVCLFILTMILSLIQIMYYTETGNTVSFSGLYIGIATFLAYETIGGDIDR